MCAGNDCTPDLRDSILLGVQQQHRNLRAGGGVVAANAQERSSTNDEQPSPPSPSRQLGEIQEEFKEGLQGAGRIIIPVVTSSIFIIIVILLIVCKVFNRIC
jgi:hypothetical protein